MRISDWSSDVCSSDLGVRDWAPAFAGARGRMIRSRRMRGLASLAAGLLLGATPALAQLSVDVTGDIDSSLKLVVPPLPAPAEVSPPAGSSTELGRKTAAVIWEEERFGQECARQGQFRWPADL